MKEGTRLISRNGFRAAYELAIASEIALPELPQLEREGVADLTIRIAPVDWQPDIVPADDRGEAHHRDAQTSFYYWTQIGTFAVRGGREIVVSPASGVDASWLRLPMLGPIIATVLLQRRRLVLHASAVVLERGGVLIVGEKGWGKSTLAAALHARGHAFLADDVVALNGGSRPMVLPAFPRLKLWPDAITMLDDDPERFPRFVNEVEKRDYRVGQRFCAERQPIHCLYLFAAGEHPAIEPLTPAEALYGLMPHSFAARLGWEPDADSRAVQFRQLAALVNNVPAFRLRRPQEHAPFMALAELIEAHARDLGRP